MKQIPDAAVQAFRQSFETTDNNCETYQDVRKALTAALSYLHPVDVAAVRRQAFEEAAKTLDAWGDIYGDNAAACVRSLSAEPEQGEQWRDMKDAPKDGTKIDVWMMPHGYRETDVFWSDIQDAWCRESEYPDEPTPLSVVPYPAFWMPLPAATTSEE